MRRRDAGALAAALLLLVLGSGFDPLQRLYRENREGVEALQEDDPERAVEHFAEAQALAPDDPRVLFNLGNALARAGRLEDARKAWARAADLAGEGTLARDAWFNRGVASLREGQAPQAVESLARALMIDPTDEEARRNLELALRQQKQQQQQRQQQQQQQQQQQEQQQQEQQEQQQQQQPAGGQGDETRKGGERRPDSAENRAERSNEERPREPEQDRRDAQKGQDRAETGADRQPKPAGDAEREMAERLLELLARGEQDALRRALRREAAPPRARERDW